MGNADRLLGAKCAHLSQDAPFGLFFCFFNYFSKAGNSPVLYIHTKNIINFIYRICIKPSFSSYSILALLNVIQKLLIVFPITSPKLRISIFIGVGLQSSNLKLLLYNYTNPYWVYRTAANR